MTEAILHQGPTPTTATQAGDGHWRLMASSADQPAEMSDAWIRDVYPRIHRAAWAMTGDPSVADDLAQETFVVALDKWDSFDRRSTRLTWLHGILIRTSRKRFRSLARLRRRLEAYWQRDPRPQVSADSSRQLALREWNESVWSEVAKLSRPQAEAITLRFACDMTYEQIAEAVGCPEGTAKTRVHHGLKQLQGCELLRDADMTEYQS